MIHMDRLGEEVDKWYLNDHRSLVRTLVDVLLVPDLLLLMCFVHITAHSRLQGVIFVLSS